MRIVKKAIATVESTESVEDGGPGTFSLILSDASEDRDGEIVDAGAFEPLPDFLSADVDHTMSVTGTVGSGTPVYSDDKSVLTVEGTFASTDLGQSTRTLVKEKHVRTASVAFIPLEKSKGEDGKVHVTKAELLNFAFTPVPSNRNAVVLSSKSVTTKEGKRNSAEDQKHLQAAHDHLVDVGAACMTSNTSEDVSGKAFAARRSIAQGKSIVGSVEALQDRCRDALEDAYTCEWGICLRGVLPDDGVLIFDYYGYGGCYDPGPVKLESGETYRQAFTDDGAVVTLTGDPEVVDIHEIVAPDADASREDQTKSATRPAGSAPADPAAPVADLDLEIQARSIAARARAALATE